QRHRARDGKRFAVLPRPRGLAERPHRLAAGGRARAAPPPVILAIDQGTTGTTCLVVDGDAVLGRGYRPVEQVYPRPGWVEHDPLQLWPTVTGAAADAVAAAGIAAHDLDAIGITNQRETTLVWHRRTGRPIANAI